MEPVAVEADDAELPDVETVDDSPSVGGFDPALPSWTVVPHEAHNTTTTTAAAHSPLRFIGRT